MEDGGIIMVIITEILDMLDWNNPLEVQSKGRTLAKGIETIAPFIQPLTAIHNKNVWDNCAIIIADSNDEKLKPHLVELLEWLQDLNWPGALCILYRLQKYSDDSFIHSAINTCVEKAKKFNDETWEQNLYMLIQMRR